MEQEIRKAGMGADLVDNIKGRLSTEEPTPKGLRFASVSMIIRNRSDPEVLLIRRAERDGDPWSGQIAFPGGKMQDGDSTARGTAVRETREEVGIDLSNSAEFLGYGAVTATHMGTMDVVPSVFLLNRAVEADPNDEVASYRWVSLKRMLAPGARSSYLMKRQGRTMELPSFVVDDYVVWGLTHRIITSLMPEID